MTTGLTLQKLFVLFEPLITVSTQLPLHIMSLEGILRNTSASFYFITDCILVSKDRRITSKPKVHESSIPLGPLSAHKTGPLKPATCECPYPAAKEPQMLDRWTGYGIGGEDISNRIQNVVTVFELRLE
ncbi:uncharacterized protein MCYG_06996 [Microsporum canis CBS 113480]|uniref:Uncharacterized protein n=1 Tax=Arthroderma otae (strain ATCC MYA-4605 / CBS 113480) TaxID=554155 RepID=C5FW93_ARTOC|nr:uncharacterized protein MCYG_06996 [Microsporum canis CBS 113480]EEQ34177.1 predicted protein [Microsporum canis CBS 113480]